MSKQHSNKLNHFIVTSIILFVAMAMQCQNVTNEILALNKEFYKSQNIAVEITTQIFMDDFSKPQKESKMLVYKSNGEYLYKNNDYESFANQTYKINIHHKKKIMIVSSVKQQSANNKVLKNVDTPNYKSELSALDTVLSFYKKVELKNLDSKNNEITFYFKNGKYEFIKVTYDKKSYMVNDCFMKLLPLSQEGSEKKHQYAYRITNKYINGNTAPKSMFDTSKYLTIKNKTVVPISSYQAYKIIDNTNIK